MSRLKLASRSVNARKVNGRTRYEKTVRKLNSVIELVGEQVELTEGDVTTIAEVEAVEVDQTGDVQLELVTGDKVELSSTEATTLLEEGEVEGTEEPEAEITEEPVSEEVEEPTEDFTVTREVVEGDNSREVSTNVEAIDELDAETKVKLLDSRRGRNTRNYNSRRVNSAPAAEPDAEVVEEIVETETEPKEFKVVRKVIANGKPVRKVASVTAPSLEDAINAVEEADKTAAIEAEGYMELVEEQPKPADVEEVAKVAINSDVEMPEGDEMAEIEEAPLSTQEEPVASTVEDKENPDIEVEVEPEIDRESNSFKGVSEFIKRAYGIEL